MHIITNKRNSAYILILSILVLIFIFSVSKGLFSKKKEVDQVGPEITCSQEDYETTPFIQQVKNNATIYIPEARTLEKLSLEELAMFYHRYVENNQYFCKRIIRLGNIKDGGWDVCDDDEYRPYPPCLVYSFGINWDFTFDDAVIKEYGCEVHSFDPSMATQSYQRSSLNHFHDIGIASKDQMSPDGWTLESFDTIHKRLKHKKTKLSIFKMDIETWEWDVIPSLVKDGVPEIDNLLIEVHLSPYTLKGEPNKDEYLRALRLLKLLYDAGYRIFRTHRNEHMVFTSTCKKIERPNCQELHMVKLKDK